jgi:hypothetical protein
MEQLWSHRSVKTAGQLVETRITAVDVQTPREVFGQLAAVIAVAYVRVPCSPNRVLRARDLDTLAAKIAEEPTSRHIFSCQLGRSRTTMAMAAACLCLRSLNCLPCDAALESLPFRNDASGQRVHHLADGNWLVVSRLRSLLPSGLHAKRELDSVRHILPTCISFPDLQVII